MNFVNKVWRSACATSLAIATTLVTSANSYAQNPGTLDASFAGSGKISSVSALNGGTMAIAIQPDGKSVVLGCFGKCIARLNVNGTLDDSFDGPNSASPGNGVFALPPVDGADVTYQALAIQADGKIVLAGKRWNGNDWDFSVARLNTTGTYDATFSGPGGTANGAFALPVEFSSSLSDEEAFAVTTQQDGKVIVAGFCGTPRFSQSCAVRLTASGAFDNTFDGDGKLQFAFSGFNHVFNAIAAQADGKIVFSGSCDRTNSGSSFCVARVNADGTPDSTFVSAQGILRFNISAGADRATALSLLPSGKLVVAGTCSGSQNAAQFCLARLNADGTFDTSLAGPLGNAGGKLLLTVGASQSTANAVAITVDGKIVLVGSCGQTAATACFVRLKPNGDFDADFDGATGNGNGQVSIALTAGENVATAIALQTDGKLMVGGACTANGVNTTTCVARLTGGPTLNQCSFDLDGDGSVTATVDMLIAMRVALGMRGDEVVHNIQFPVLATRNSWSAIRDYLFNQCGINTN